MVVLTPPCNDALGRKDAHRTRTSGIAASCFCCVFENMMLRVKLQTMLVGGGLSLCSSAVRFKDIEYHVFLP
jgi:hypothetical protein